MWFVFERLYPRPAAVQMVRQFVRSARLLAALNSVGPGDSEIARIRALRDEINSVFASVNSEADAVLFEGGEQRAAFLAGRDRLRRWMSSLRTLYLLELPLLPSGEDKERSPLNRSGDAQLLLRLSSPLTRIAGHLENEIGGGSNGHPKQESAKDERIRVVTTDDVSSLKDAANLTPPQS